MLKRVMLTALFVALSAPAALAAEEGPGLIGIDHTLFIQVINFLVIVFVAKKFIIDPVQKTTGARDGKIESLVVEARDLREKVEAYQADYNERMGQLKAEMAELHRTMKESATAEANKKVAAVKAELDAKVEQARAEIEAEVKKAESELSAKVGELSKMIVDKILTAA